MGTFLEYYKWHIIFFVLVIICFLFAFMNMTTSERPDVTIGYIGTNYVNVQTFNDNKGEFELLLRDADENGKSTAEMYAYAVDLQADLDEAFLEMIETESYQILISTKKAFENLEDKTVFVPVDEFVNLKGKKLSVLEDKKAGSYAVSLKDNEHMKKMGILSADDLYIAVYDSKPDKNGEIPVTAKNGRNIAGYILGEE